MFMSIWRLIEEQNPTAEKRLSFENPLRRRIFRVPSPLGRDNWHPVKKDKSSHHWILSMAQAEAGPRKPCVEYFLCLGQSSGLRGALEGSAFHCSHKGGSARSGMSPRPTQLKAPYPLSHFLNHTACSKYMGAILAAELSGGESHTAEHMWIPFYSAALSMLTETLCSGNLAWTKRVTIKIHYTCKRKLIPKMVEQRKKSLTICIKGFILWPHCMQ